MQIDLSKDLVIRWDNPDAAHIPLLKESGVQAVLLSVEDAAFSQACANAGLTLLRPSDLQFAGVGELATLPDQANVVLTNGLWPGISKPPNVEGRGDETASASREPWLDSNGYWVGYLRALYPDRPPVLGYLPDLGDRAVPFSTLELALVEAWSAGGNYLLAVERDYRAALLRKDPKALAAWKKLGRTAAWLRENITLFRRPSLPVVTALVEPGAATAEIANLLYRRNASPSLCSIAALPAPDPRSRLALVAANLKQPSPEVAKRILAHAITGTTVVTAGPASGRWWRAESLKQIRSEPDRDFFSLGKGQLVAYRAPVADPSEFALDVIDIVTHRERAVRVWNAPAVIALATDSPRAGERLVHLVNYGSPIDTEVQARVQGHFKAATLLRPDASPVQLRPARRGGTTEVFVPELNRLGVVVFR